MEQTGTRRIIDITMFWNEDTIVEERVRNTLSYADYLVVAEGSESHSGLLKRPEPQFPRALEDARSRLTGLDLGRVIFVQVDLSNAAGKTPAEREKIVRDAAFAEVLKRGLLRVQDVLVVQDFDEFLHPSSRSQLLNHFSGWAFWRKVLRLRYRMTYYKLNLLEAGDWDLGLAIRGSVALESSFSPNFYRHDIRKKAFPLSREFLGWHHSYLGDAKKIIEKLKSFSHALDEMVVNVSEQDLVARLERGEDLYGRGFQYQRVDYSSMNGIPSLSTRRDLMI
ncbi:MAG: hypothetical protein JST80_04015 [Bdellovibrionales bacterium]|nr:hypothetical protein [Bdellovibrionales bacterium]